MVKLLGATLPESKKLWVALTRIYGIGQSRARELCFTIGATPHVKASELRPHHLSQLYNYIDERYIVGNDLKRVERDNIQRLVDIGSYRGMRHLQNLPVRGQRTHTNARTQKKLNRLRFIKQPEKEKQLHPRFLAQQKQEQEQTKGKK